MNEKGIEPPPREPLSETPALWLVWNRWFQLLRAAFPRVATYSPSLTPASVAANTTAEQTFTVTGLTTADVVLVNKPTHQAGLGIAGARVSAADTLAITFVNPTGGSITPTAAETYRVVAVRL